jgi:hypothetical protein
LRFYANFFLIAISSTLVGCSYPLMSRNMPVKKEFIILVYFAMILLLMSRLLRHSWTEFTEHRNLDYRRDVVAALIFAFFLVILNSGIFLTLTTNLTTYSSFVMRTT